MTVPDVTPGEYTVVRKYLGPDIADQCLQLAPVFGDSGNDSGVFTIAPAVGL